MTFFNLLPLNIFVMKQISSENILAKRATTASELFKCNICQLKEKKTKTFFTENDKIA